MIHLTSLLTSFIGLAAIYVDTQMAQFGRWRLSERAMEWHAIRWRRP
jgi:uncharacterized membrane protein YsdA (DUF1294 family)